MKLYRLGDSKTPVDPADFNLVNQHARTALLNINFGLQQDTAEHHALKAAATGQGAEEPDAVVVSTLDECCRGASKASLGTTVMEDTMPFTMTFHDDVDESADASELDVSDQGPVEPVHEVALEDLQAEIDFVETASRHELLRGGSQFDGLSDDDGELSSGRRRPRRPQRGNACG